MIRNQKIKETVICGLLFFICGVFQSCLDRFLIGVQAFIQIMNFFIFSRLCTLVFICYNFYALNSSPITSFFKCIILQQILSLFSTINLACLLEISILGRFEYSLPKIWISSTYAKFIVENRGNIWCDKKRTFLALNFIKISFLWLFLI